MVDVYGRSRPPLIGIWTDYYPSFVDIFEYSLARLTVPPAQPNDDALPMVYKLAAIAGLDWTPAIVLACDVQNAYPSPNRPSWSVPLWAIASLVP
ncbi:hypothetical protein FRB99_007143 [Tulasnella sp. 403]|nr:hypothetical protein FRB99_007143 [Tulasnella sp. 403]